MNLSSISLGGEATLIFSSKMEIRGIHLDSQIYFSIVQNLNNSHSVAIDGDYIYWSQSTHGNQMIIKMLMGIEDKKENVVRMGKRFIKNYNSDISFSLRSCKRNTYRMPPCRQMARSCQVFYISCDFLPRRSAKGVGNCYRLGHG